MKRLPRPKERTATPEELAEDTRRCQEARAQHRPLAPRPPEPTEGNLCACLVTLARWRKCCTCGSETLYVNEQARTTGDFECGLCVEIRESLAKRLRPTPKRRLTISDHAAFHLRGLFSVGNDNAEA